MPTSRRSLLLGVGGLAGVGGIGAIAFDGAGTTGDSTAVNALVAGSLLRLAENVPGATIEAHGSAAVRRLVSNDLRSPDAVALADPRLFDGISDRATLFATNALVLTYSPTSAHAAAIRRDWKTAIERGDVRLGRTDPNTDPLGYRTVMALRLAADAYGVDAQAVLGNSRIFRETDMLNVLEGGKIDAAFAYRNMAVQRDLPHVSLPDAVDFSNPDYTAMYGTAAYELNDRTLRGAPIRYAASALTDAGEAWVEKLVTGDELLREAGFVVPDEYPMRDRRVGGAPSQ